MKTEQDNRTRRFQTGQAGSGKFKFGMHDFMILITNVKFY